MDCFSAYDSLTGGERIGNETVADLLRTRETHLLRRICHALYEAAKEAVQKLDLQIKVEYITDRETIMAYGVMRMPAPVMGDRAVSMGKVLKPKEIEALLRG